MAKPSFLDTLGHYMKGDDLDRAKTMLEKTEEEFIAYELENICVKKTPQVLFGRAFIRTRACRSHGYPIAGLFIVNKGAEPASYSVRLEIDRSIVFTLERKLSGNSSSYEIFSVDDDQLSAYVNVPVYCKVSVTDSFEREIASTAGELKVVSELTRPQIEVVFKPSKSFGQML